METAERTVAGRYRLLESLGAGGMGRVWRAQDTVLGRDVALKEITFPPEVADDEREVLRERTRREGRAAARLEHTSAVTVYDVAEEDGMPFLVMELVEAPTLADVVREQGPLSAHRTAEIGLAVLGALEAAHAEGIVHRDVKPSNVLLREDGRVVLTDFGIATFTGDAQITSSGLLLGSPSFIAPERARGEQPAPSSDLWSLGATLFTAVEGRPPFDKGEALPTLTAVITGEHEPFTNAGPLGPVLDGLLEKDPALRYDATRAREGLQAVLTSAAATTTAAPTRPVSAPSGTERTQALDLGAVAQEVRVEQAVSPRRRSSRAPLVVGILVALALVAGVVALVTRPDQPGTGTGASPQQQQSQGSTVPEGWVTHDGDGWSVAVPSSYTAGTFGGFPQYKDKSSGRTLRVSMTAPGGGKADAVQDRRDQAVSFARSHDNYREIGIGKADYRGLEAADWEFTYASGGAVLHALSRVFVIDGRGYSLFFQTRSTDDWSAALRDFDKIAASFRT